MELLESWTVSVTMLWDTPLTEFIKWSWDSMESFCVRDYDLDMLCDMVLEETWKD